MGFYKNTIPNQKIGIFTNPVEGLNAWQKSTVIGDNQLSNAMDALPYRGSAVKLYAPETITALVTQDTGYVVSAVSWANDSDEEFVCVLFTEYDGISANQLKVIKLTKSNTDGKWSAGTAVVFDTTAFPANKHAADNISTACVFYAEKKQYAVFTMTSDVEADGDGKLLYYNITDGTVDSVDNLKFVPKHIVYHANRIFATDTNNRIWWSKAGSFKNTSDWYGTSSTKSSVIEDSGYWAIEKERKLGGLGVLGNTLYVFGYNNIYAFTGYDYDTFALQTAVPDLSSKVIAQNGSAIYFMYDNGSSWDIYEFDGTEYPRIISRPVRVGDRIVNGIAGGVEIPYATYYSKLSANENYLYVFFDRFNVNDAYVVNNTYDRTIYAFNIIERSWWKIDGGIDETTRYTTSESSVFKMIVPSAERNSSYLISCLWEGTLSSPNTVDAIWNIYDELGYNADEYPHIITKAFSALPTDKQALTSVALQFQAEDGADIDLTVSYSKTIDQDDFEIIKQYDHYIANGLMETLDIPLPIRLVSNVRHYRIKVTVKNAALYLYNIERRYRVTGRSR
jgi:hypothetical protein